MLLEGDRTTNDEWETPQELFNGLNLEFDFTLDPCCTEETAKCERFYTIKENGLEQSWNNERVFMNPPYSETTKWVKKAYLESLNNTLVVGLLPSWTDRKWFHEWVYHKAEIRFIHGRTKYTLNNIPTKWYPMFGSMITIWRKNNEGM